MIRADAKRKKLRDGLHGSAAVVAVGTHDAMSARLAESYGFDAIWVSGFGVSTMTYAIPDLNLITMTEALAAAVRMDAATNLPVVADCDNGFGGLSNVVRTIVEYERAGIAGICIEDNAFPKRNSLLEGAANRALISINEQSRRIRAAKEAQETNNVVLIARVEALIAGYGVEDACRRADAYAEAGADAILIHSRDRTLSEIEAFLGKWQGLGKVPLVAVPTLFPMFTVEQLHEKGFQMVILANQLMRASVKAMEDTLETLKKLRNAAALEGQIASVNHIFELVKTEGTIEFEETPDQDVSTPDAAASPGLASRGNRVQPTNTFIEFKEEEIEQSIAERFERMVGEHAARVAVKTRTERVTYSDLNRWANQVARAILANRGWGEEPVAVVMEAGPSFLAAILGVLKTGRFYVPLDPSYPVVRIGYILNDSTAGLLLTNDQNYWLARKLAPESVHLINVDEIDSNLAKENLGLSISPDALAYVIYTSGATGQPKGVMQNQRNVLHKAMEYTNSVHVSADDRLALLYSPSTSGAVRDIFSSLLNGASLYPFNVRQEGVNNLAHWVIDEQITVYNSVATIFRQFVSTFTGQEKFPDLRLIHVGSETIYKRDVELYKTYFTDQCIFVANLGSTEVSPIRQFFVDKQTQITGSTVPVGYAVKDTEVLLLDDDGNQAGVNEVGEIAVRSRYLSPGYWRKPDLTQAAFSSNTNGGDLRVYRTGDLGRMMSDGCLVHLGRKDFQVKIRGHRIELAEIEMALFSLGAIKETVVVAREDRPGDKRLVAYLVARSNPAPTVSAVRRALVEKLPDHMIPSAFVFLDALPQTTTGKVDRKALPPPSRKRPELETALVLPRTPVESALANIWSGVLGLDQVGADDNFLDLGGNSLAAIQVISRVIATFGVDLPLRSLFESSTLGEMGERIEAARWIQQGIQVGAGDPSVEREAGEL